jgi:SAM-dependent methyltransferase
MGGVPASRAAPSEVIDYYSNLDATSDAELRFGAAVSSTTHDRTVVDQFTRQAVPFATAPIHQDGMACIRALSRITDERHVLDVACGPGLVACALAAEARCITGIDLTPRMIEEARATARTQSVGNVTWLVGSAMQLPFADATFSVVLTRYSFHHFTDPAAAFDEMYRVCRPGGRLVVADLSIAPPAGARFDAVERLRDPSHVHALTPTELRSVFERRRVMDIEEAEYGLDIELEPQLTRSFPVDGGAEQIRQAYAGSIAHDLLGIRARLIAGSLWSTWPVRVVGATKA